MNGPSTPYWDRLNTKAKDTMKQLKAFVAKLIAKIKSEPAVATGGVVGAVGVILTWIKTNNITTLRQAVTLATPIVVTFVIRTFVTPSFKFDAVQRQLTLLKEAVDGGVHKPTPELSKLLAETESKVFPGAVTEAPPNITKA